MKLKLWTYGWFSKYKTPLCSYYVHDYYWLKCSTCYFVPKFAGSAFGLQDISRQLIAKSNLILFKSSISLQGKLKSLNPGDKW